METLWDAVDVLPVGLVPVELLDSINRTTVTLEVRNIKSEDSFFPKSTEAQVTHLESVWMLVSRPYASFRVE